MLLSIHLNSNKPENIAELVKNIDDTARKPSDIEVIINIDEGDDGCKNILDSLKNQTAVKIKYIQTDIIKSFKDVWKPYNELLKLTDPSVYFVTLFSDEFRFKTKNWDDIIRKYIGYYEDDIFRIRLSRYRYRNYSDFWECIFAPDSLAFYTKKWMDIVGMWCPCTGPDSWQQLVAFYLISSRKFDHIQYNRDIPEAFIEFEGEGASAGLTGLKAKQRIKDNVDLWFETVSHSMQEKAKYAAANLQASIIMHKSNANKQNISHNFVSNRKPPMFSDKNLDDIYFTDNKTEKKLEFFCKQNGSTSVIYVINYRLNKVRFCLVNNLRKLNYAYFAGGGEESYILNFITQLNTYFRIRKYGHFAPKEIVVVNQPEFLKRYDNVWLAIKFFLAIGKLMGLALLKITYTTKYYRLIRFKLFLKNDKKY